MTTPSEAVEIYCVKCKAKTVTVQTCGDLRAIKPLTEGQPSTEFALQADSSPQT